MPESLLTPRQARQLLQVCRNTLTAMIRDGRVEAVNINPGGRRATWRIKADSLEGLGALEDQMKWLDVKRRCGL